MNGHAVIAWVADMLPPFLVVITFMIFGLHRCNIGAKADGGEE